MPAMLDDPMAPVIYRTSGEAPFPTPHAPLPKEIEIRQVTLRDRVTKATLIPFSAPEQVPASLLNYLCAQLNREIEKGDTYPMINAMSLESFGPYWFANFGAVMLLGEIQDVQQVKQMEENGRDWEKECLGSFYIKPNYPGRSSHVCNGGFLVTDASRNRGVGRLMGEGYLEWAPKLGYTYSVFNLVYETNVASLRIWDALGFKRIGKVRGCGNLRSYPDYLVDAIIYGRDLGPEGEDFVSEERFDKIRFYLKNGSYPNGADRAEKSRLRSAATHYRLVPRDDPNEEEKLMLKDKEVISDPVKQYDVAKLHHNEHHGGINKTTALISEKYHWVRIKETVSLVIKNCDECKEASKTPAVPSKRLNGSASSAGTSGSGASKKSSSQSQPSSPGLRGKTPPESQQPLHEITPAPLVKFTPSTVLASSESVHPAPVVPEHGFQEYEMPLDPQMLSMEGVEHHGVAYVHPAQPDLLQHDVMPSGYPATHGTPDTAMTTDGTTDGTADPHEATLSEELMRAGYGA
ncbi:hypothetical protein BJ546DRAFT_596063 [Cryomyces antarcticus]